MSEREAFEKKFPAPMGVEWIDENQGYRITSDDAYWWGEEGQAHFRGYLCQWFGWQARALADSDGKRNNAEITFQPGQAAIVPDDSWLTEGDGAQDQGEAGPNLDLPPGYAVRHSTETGWHWYDEPNDRPAESDYAGKIEAVIGAWKDFSLSRHFDVGALVENLERNADPHLAEKVHYACREEDDTRTWKMDFSVQTSAHRPAAFGDAMRNFLNPFLKLTKPESVGVPEGFPGFLAGKAAALLKSARMNMAASADSCMDEEDAEHWLTLRDTENELLNLASKNPAQGREQELEWIYRAPSHGEGDYLGQVWALDRLGEVEILDAEDAIAEFRSGDDAEIVAFQPTGLKRPNPPQPQSSGEDEREEG